MPSTSRDDFSAATKERLRRRVNSHCSRPECDASTEGPALASEKHVSIGVAAHICGAALGSARYDVNQTHEERKSFANGIWLCQSCSRLIDTDEARFPPELLRQWKETAEHKYFAQIGRPQSLAENRLAKITPARRFGTAAVALFESGGTVELATISEMGEGDDRLDWYLEGYLLRFKIQKRDVYSAIELDGLVATVHDFRPPPRYKPVHAVEVAEFDMYLVEIDKTLDKIPRTFTATRFFEVREMMQFRELVAQPRRISDNRPLTVTVRINAATPGLYVLSLDAVLSADGVEEKCTVLAPSEVIFRELGPDDLE